LIDFREPRVALSGVDCWIGDSSEALPALALKLVATAADSAVASVVAIKSLPFCRSKQSHDIAVLMKIQLANGETHSVIAVEHASGSTHMTFWILDGAFKERLVSGLSYPTIVPASDCMVVEDSIPKHWKIASHKYTNSCSRTIIGPPPFLSRSFLEGLVNGTDKNVASFLAETKLARW
jgi:hypothetical protein